VKLKLKTIVLDPLLVFEDGGGNLNSLLASRLSCDSIRDRMEYPVLGFPSCLHLFKSDNSSLFLAYLP
jgi:hypothetical protein